MKTARKPTAAQLVASGPACSSPISALRMHPSRHCPIRIVDAEEVANVIAYLVFGFVSYQRGLT